MGIESVQQLLNQQIAAGSEIGVREKALATKL